MTFIPMGVMYLHARMFCTLTHTSSIPIGVINFHMQECFLHSLIRLLYPWVWCIYMQECSVHSLICLLFPWVQCQSLKPVWGSVAEPVLWQLMILLLCTLAHMSSIHARTFFTLADTMLYPLWVPIFTVITEVWPHANQAVFKNNLTVIIEVVLIESFL